MNRFGKSKLCQARALVYELIPHLKWRHSGLGMLQAYLVEGGREEMRVHIWHPSLKLSGIDSRGLGHDHRFDMTSWVLVGQLRHVEVQTVLDAQGDFQVYEVVNARKALRETGTLAGDFRECPNSFNLTRTVTHVSAGEVYSVPKRVFHESYPDLGLVITIVMKTNQDEVPARILSRTGEAPLNAFSSTVDKDECARLLSEAQGGLLTENRLNSCSTEDAPRGRHVESTHLTKQFPFSKGEFIDRILRELRRACDCLSLTLEWPPMASGEAATSTINPKHSGMIEADL